VVSRVGNQQDAEDIVSDVFVSVIEAIANFEYRHSGSFVAWIFRIAHNAVQSHYRHTLHKNLIPLNTLFHLKSEDATPDEALSQKERFQRIQAMIATLSPRRQAIISLRFFGELRNQEIAEVLGLNEKTVASHLSRGLEDLQRKYGQKDIEHE
jgi:RNA polymerase sigma-70 factor (ECF subfamily)